MRKISICDGWSFVENITNAFINFTEEGTAVRLPHTSKEVPVHYMEESACQMICGYRRHLNVPELWKGRRLFLQFDGAAHVADIFVNGEKLMTHYGGYTAFRIEITDKVLYGVENRIVVRLNTREDANVPPFGHVIDYMTYGGMYREAWLLLAEQSYVEDVFVQTPDMKQALIDVTISRPDTSHTLELSILDQQQKVVGHKSLNALGTVIDKCSIPVDNAQPWSPETPYLYTLIAALRNQQGEIIDEYTVSFGFRQAVFRGDGFYLNGRKYKIRGVNRHQSYAHVGYAMPASMQIEDARILKEELHVNAVRTSHYPQSQHFLDACDRMGLLVFTETPGWQHIKNDDEWKRIVCENVGEMIMQYRNHPSIILWGVRVNESQDDDALYTRTNEIARRLDQSRQTSGVRFLWRSSLLEDVYAFNDFSHTGKNGGLLPRWLISPNKSKGYLIAEFNGHMFPTKSTDTPTHRLSHAIRHANVLNEVYKREDIAGAFGWCMFDYQTHGDFGSGDRICYHGIMDIYRNPKLASKVYASFSEEAPVLEVGSDMHIGDYPGGAVGENYIFTNADSVRLYKNERMIREFMPVNKKYRHLPHPPIEFYDTVGNVIEEGEKYSHKKAEAIKECLLAIQRFGTALPPKYIFKAMWVMLRHLVSPVTFYRLFFKYIENWGVSAPVYRFEAVKNGKVVAEVTKASNASLHLETMVSGTSLTEAETYDVASIRIRVTDINNNNATYSHLPVFLKAEGNIEIIGPDCVTAEGGMCGTYIRSTGAAGNGTLTISTHQTEPVVLRFSVNIEGRGSNERN
ncbi:glycoside hydrolase family 2 TIM barrel-domain containing protein [Paenibacillus sp. MMS20-IR301]|uniref:glycoside hydrolase family 2 protein n=1 Tax=Paenibacillus sp. MMS20-IR301 TaxID=2895946 RepID=UPI0028F05F0C|nr:glycoside hydrolase family 2 TIM barrel-domain containing protein [Paenibacillus sp. MMS20-IR301]WNS40822.1 glycoside hydrolase family 2 TIM barrel-domain containing protein [Paenibacillus sp. MMS20-IR301]